MLCEAAVVLTASPGSPTKSVAELIELAKTKPEGLSIASSGFGTLGHFLATSLSAAANGKIQHVPYRGGLPAVTAVVSGEIPYAIIDTGAAASFLNQKTVIGLAVSGTKPAPGFPSIPPFSETNIPNSSMNAWIPAMAPKGTPRPILNKLNDQIQRFLKDEKFKDVMLRLGLAPVEDVGVEKLDEFVKLEVQRWKKIVADSGLKME
jgi:tripartite-type tricarboxylate transporter receptor subunit TctC